jgi:FolB domain-containing protein
MSDHPVPPQPARVDVAILGGGPAGCSAASWLAQLGLSVALVERAPELCASLQGLTFRQDWVLGAPGQTLAELGRQYAAQTEAQQPGLTLLKGRSPTHVDWHAGEGWRLRLDDGRDLTARALLLATGLRPLRPTPFFPDAGPGHECVLDALSLTARRDQLPPGQRILLLGGGDNAAENALFLQARGHRVTLWSRSDWRAQQALVDRIEAAGSAIAQRPRTPLPNALRADTAGVTVNSKTHGDERFDLVAVLLGYEAEPSAWLLVADALQRAGITAPSHPFRDEPRFAPLGLFVAGDASGRQHPSVQTALGDGVAAAKQIEAFLRPSREGQPPLALRRNNRQIIHITGLRFGANLGVLDFEREGPQPIQVDAEVNLGAQAIVARDADIGHVLDYRKVRSIIIDECTAEHTDLLEALLGKLCTRLMKLHGVVGVRIKVTKLEIFPDCQVAISAECGQW